MWKHPNIVHQIALNRDSLRPHSTSKGLQAKRELHYPFPRVTIFHEWFASLLAENFQFPPPGNGTHPLEIISAENRWRLFGTHTHTSLSPTKPPPYQVWHSDETWQRKANTLTTSNARRFQNDKQRRAPFRQMDQPSSGSARRLQSPSSAVTAPKHWFVRGFAGLPMMMMMMMAMAIVR